MVCHKLAHACTWHAGGLCTYVASAIGDDSISKHYSQEAIGILFIEVIGEGL